MEVALEVAFGRYLLDHHLVGKREDHLVELLVGRLLDYKLEQRIITLAYLHRKDLIAPINQDTYSVLITCHVMVYT